jgi:mannose-1-phosphate guanylyltransferase
VNTILLSGGSGKRLWPLSNEIRSKQFLKLFKMSDGNYESMLQRVYRQIKKMDPTGSVTIATSKKQVSAIYNQLGEAVEISVEPYRRDTFPAIALATAYLHDIMGVPSHEAVVVCPVDPYVEENYFDVIKELYEQAQIGTSNLVLMGIEPTYPSEKYGYIIPYNKEKLSDVAGFKEKPGTPLAKEYIKQGALWNGGVFAYKLEYVLNIAKNVFGNSDYLTLYENYELLPKISFDYAVVEKEKNIKVVKYSGEWTDLGSWNTLTEAMSENIIGEGVLDDACENVHIINELDVPILAMGVKDVVISASPDGILVSDKDQSGYLKKYAETIAGDVKFAEKSWGCFKVINAEKDSLTIKVTIKAGDGMNYHSHEHRDEVWVVTSGEGLAIVDGMETPVKAGDVITMTAGCRHTINAIKDLTIIEVQLGTEINVQDKKKYE